MEDKRIINILVKTPFYIIPIQFVVSAIVYFYYNRGLGFILWILTTVLLIVHVLILDYIDYKKNKD